MRTAWAFLADSFRASESVENKITQSLIHAYYEKDNYLFDTTLFRYYIL